jgi:hypothetical protein
MQVEPSRIIIVDTGSGKFTNMSARKALVDLMGICDEDTKISVFYTDSVIKSEVNNSYEVEGKKIEWYKYRSTADIVATMLQHSKKENYIFDMEQHATETDVESLLHTRGIRVNVKDNMNLGMPTILMEEIRVNMTGDIPEEHQIQGYQIKI